MPTIQQQINQLKKDKETLNTMLNTMGVETTGNETFTQLTPLVGKIVTDPILQDKTIEITENGTTNIVADEGYNGLNNVEVTTNVKAGVQNEMNLFIQKEEPEKKSGIWIQKENEPINNICIENITVSEKWNVLNDSFPILASYQRVVKINNYLYVFGGKVSAGTTTNKAYKYNLTNNSVENLTNMPLAIRGCGIGAVGTNIYLFGGSITSGSTTYTNKAYKYDILTNAYTEIASLPKSYSDMMFATVGTDIYLLGGTTDGGYAGTLANVYKYDTLTNTYTEMAAMPNGTRVGTACAVGTDIYMFNGHDTYNPITNVRKYDTLTNTYTTLAQLPKTYSHLASGLIGNDIYLIGGYDGGGLTNLYKYSISNNSFTQLANTPHAIYNTGYCSDGTNIYLVGGQTTGGYLDDIVEYGLVGDVVFEENTVVISTNENLYSSKISNNLSLYFNDVYIYNSEEKGYITSPTYYGDGTKWIKIKN